MNNTKKLVVGFDLDDSIVSLQSVIKKKLLEEHNYRMPYREPSNYGYLRLPEYIRKIIFNMFKDKNIMCNLKPFYGVVKTIEQWNKKNEIYIISSRFDEIKNESIDFVKKILPFIKTKNIIITNNKKKFFKKLNLDLWIDDRGEDCKIASDLGISVYMVSNESTVYNHFAKSYPGIYTIKSINELRLGK